MGRLSWLEPGWSMYWTALLAAGVFEVAWALGLKYTDQFTRVWPTLWTLAAMAASVFLLMVSLKELPLGTAYAIWTGIGAVGTALVGMVLFGEPAEPLRLACVAVIVAGMVGLKLAS